MLLRSLPPRVRPLTNHRSNFSTGSMTAAELKAKG